MVDNATNALLQLKGALTVFVTPLWVDQSPWPPLPDAHGGDAASPLCDAGPTSVIIICGHIVVISFNWGGIFLVKDCSEKLFCGITLNCQGDKGQVYSSIMPVYNINTYRLSMPALKTL